MDSCQESTPDPLPFETADPRGEVWTEDAHRLLLQGRLQASVALVGGIETSSVDGECPRCHHHLTDVQIRTVTTEGTKAVLGHKARKRSSGYASITVTCSCGCTHAGRPEDANGCGITFRIEVLKEVK
jgi:hypothetical protein